MILFYVSGHGFGHATRTRAVLDALTKMHPEIPLHVRTAAPRFLFGEQVRYSQAEFEPRMVESANALAVDEAASLRFFEEFLPGLSAVVEREVAFVRASGARLIAADIPFVAGLVAQEANVPAVAMGNFTWDWILGSVPGADAVVEVIRKAYGHFETALRYPLSHREGWEVFRNVRDVPLVMPRSLRSRREIRTQLGLTDDGQTSVLVGGRATLLPDVLRKLELQSEGCVFLHNNSLPNFHDVLRAADVVVSKIGYSVAAECIAESKALLYPPRFGFREEEILRREVPRYTRALTIPPSDWERGEWLPYIRRLLQLPEPSEHAAVDGAEVCARILADYWCGS